MLSAVPEPAVITYGFSLSILTGNGSTAPYYRQRQEKKHEKKDKVSDDILDVAALSLKKFRKVTRQIGKLSTGQKLVGGLALAAAGLAYLAQQKTDAAGEAPAAKPDSPLLLGSGHRPAQTEYEPTEAPASKKRRKNPRARPE